ncbi:hypothetical protein [Deinococcus sp. AJ005]|uniref:hypothetical protein n=1 Tax=Deinococcus sp. AJ005 TaxID=2652443 RepID=UPI00125CCAC4|nr:hypothetical protein [Deinococcus sp. AJ005]QFP75277.1 hypothetical protein DAAJ005_01640 [Deinococcus sp. AJ005]
MLRPTAIPEVPALPQGAAEMEQPELTVENIEAGLIDFKAVAEATRLKMQRHSGKGQTLALGRRTTASKTRGMQESAASLDSALR